MEQIIFTLAATIEEIVAKEINIKNSQVIRFLDKELAKVGYNLSLQKEKGLGRFLMKKRSFLIMLFDIKFQALMTEKGKVIYNVSFIKLQLNHN